MTVKTAAAGGAAAVAIFAVGVTGATIATSNEAADTVTTMTFTTPIPACTAVTARGQLNDPCNVEQTLWQQSNRNALSNMAYYSKWKAANPGEYSKLKTWSVSDPVTPDPTLNTAFGVLVRYGIQRCRLWAPTIQGCALP